MSGGPDSLALAILAVAQGCVVTAHYVDHRLRPESASEGRFVATTLTGFGVATHVRVAPVPLGPDLEGRARTARRHALPAGTLMGHTADDQAETVLLALLRGTGPDGMAAMSLDRHPLLGLRRSETHRLCEELGIAAIDDPSNRDPRFRRNRVRHELLPLMNEIADRDVTPLVARMAALQRRTLEALDTAYPTDDAASVAALESLPDVVAARMMRAWWRDRTGLEHAPDAAATQRMIEVARGHVPRADIGRGWLLGRTRGRLWLRRNDGWTGPLESPSTTDG